jgi:hypothetical protein
MKDIVDALSVKNGGLGFSDTELVEDGVWVGRVIDENTFVLALGRADLHEKALSIAYSTGKRGKIPFLLVRGGFNPLRYKLTIVGLTVEEAVDWMRSEARVSGFFGPFMVRKQGKGKPENTYREVPEDYVLRPDDILRATG